MTCYATCLLLLHTETKRSHWGDLKSILDALNICIPVDVDLHVDAHAYV